MSSLIQATTKVLEEREQKEKTTLWASESETMSFEIFHRWMGTPPTNPIKADKQVLMNAGKMLEESLVSKWKQAGIAQDHEEEQVRIEMTREGVPISGYVDALHMDGYPVEVKSFYGYYQKKDLQNGNARLSYLKQLCIYMDALGVDKGKLFYMERGDGTMFEFDVQKYNHRKYACGHIEIDLQEVYERWAKLYNNYILKEIEPPIPYRYKIPPSQIDWSQVSKTDIKKARSNQKVIGDHPWMIQYSAYKDLILERQGVTAGYTDDELDQIRRYTNALI